MHSYYWFHSIVILIFHSESGHLYSFGNNGEAQLGIGTSVGQNNSTPMCLKSLEPMTFKMLAAGTDHSVALTGRVPLYLIAVFELVLL